MPGRLDPISGKALRAELRFLEEVLVKHSTCGLKHQPVAETSNLPFLKDYSPMDFRLASSAPTSQKPFPCKNPLVSLSHGFCFVRFNANILSQNPSQATTREYASAKT